MAVPDRGERILTDRFRFHAFKSAETPDRVLHPSYPVHFSGILSPDSALYYYLLLVPSAYSRTTRSRAYCWAPSRADFIF